MSVTIDDARWNEAYTQMYPHARKLVYSLNVPHWQGQEDDVAWDIVQESMSRVVEYTQKAERGEREPVQSLMGLLKIVAQNYSRDLRRREWRLSKEATGTAQEFVADEASFSEVAIENAYRENLFRDLAHEIAGFPQKQRQSLLTDLARRMAFDEEPTSLELAFRTEGIFLEEYRTPDLQSKQAYSRNAALLVHAYKRLKSLEVVQKYLAS